jgi:hypothetical protein
VAINTKDIRTSLDSERSCGAGAVGARAASAAGLGRAPTFPPLVRPTVHIL